MRRRVRLLALAAALLLLLASLGVSYVSWRSADELVHPERRAITAFPSGAGLAYENVSFVTADGLRLGGWWVPAAGEPNGTVLFLHGYGDARTQALPLLPFLHRAGYHVLAFDFRAHGESGGDHTTVGFDEVEDVRAAYAYLNGTRGVDGSRVALLGYSMGAATALNAAASLPEVDAIVADSAFATLTNIASNSITHFTDLPRYPFGPMSVVFAGWMVGRDVAANRPIDAARGLHAPVLVVQGGADDIALPDADGRALFAAAPEGSDFWLVPDARHVQAQALDPDAYAARVTAFLQRYVK